MRWNCRGEIVYVQSLVHSSRGKYPYFFCSYSKFLKTQVEGSRYAKNQLLLCIGFNYYYYIIRTLGTTTDKIDR